MDAKQAIQILVQSAEYYHNYLENKNIMFIYGDDFQFIETVFYSKNFLHLTGVIVNGKNENEDGVWESESNYFYDKCLHRKLSMNDFRFKKDKTTIYKLPVLAQTLNFKKNTKMLGNYNESKLLFKTDVLAGSTCSCIGFVKADGNYYIPNSILDCDTRDLILKPCRLMAILSKSIKEKIYSTVEYKAKNINVDMILHKINSGTGKINSDLINVSNFDTATKIE